ncbi:EAL domain-containing protein [Ruminococcus flavefaciens]|uniref:bifunctional diguanylate cyclase/phosphodiesterase n=1 Tax=Ruminococcus flavefaciens TaxID=1265 RepID=UPI0013D9F26D|nr:EAL domain-containing protein [Ruminococcus flavefaciens]
MNKQGIFDNIAESLARSYDIIYYINAENGNYTRFTSAKIYGDDHVKEDGKNFFSDAQRNAEKIIAPKDIERVKFKLKKESIISALEIKKLYTFDYTLLIDGEPRFARATVSWARDKLHLIIGVEDTVEEIRRENALTNVLSLANEVTRRDELTGIKNKTAFDELAKAIQENINNGLVYLPFALIVCDVSGITQLNENFSSSAGDEQIIAACKLICNIFTHSPVFRIDGDKFAVLLRGIDYENRNALFEDLHEQVVDNIKCKDGPVLAAGMAVFNSDEDNSFTSVFERAENLMYKDKKAIKSGETGKSSIEYINGDVSIPLDRKEKLDRLFNAFSIFAEGTYVYLCDMRYDYSRWSKKAVDLFGLPSEYMVNAAKIWDSHIHPEDVNTYRDGIEAIFSGKTNSHDMQYRARKINGEYDVCTCRGTVMYSPKGIPEYFCGTIRNHSVQGYIDALSGLQNQYGFFEDIEAKILKTEPFKVVMLGLTKFSEINEVYGYHFGNLVLQKYARYLYEAVGNYGTVYRLDGTKFAVMIPNSNYTVENIKSKYSTMCHYFRNEFFIDNELIILDTSAGLLSVDNFNIDPQTVYACLNYAYGESKLRRQGDIVEFGNRINEDKKHRTEVLHVIRSSIMQDFHGFFLLYQPVVDALTEKVIGAEALLRWKNDEYGMVPPDSFIPVLEKDPIFFELGQWILRTALIGAKKLREKYPNFIINVNLSYNQLEKPNFVDMVLETLADADYPPEALCLEITERCRLLDMDLLKNIVVNLRGRGIKIALDDFGTGFSSINIVKSLPFDVIKIDRSLVMKIEENPQDRQLIAAIANMIRSYSTNVCAEGIETAAMRDILLNYEVDCLQGYYYSKPIPIEDFLNKFDA